MHPEGHAGLTLIFFSLLMIPFGLNENTIIIIFLATASSSIPDLDMKWEFFSHRGPTHSLLFAIIMGIFSGILLFFGTREILWFFIGFTSGFGGVVSHLIGDLLNPMRFKPLWPFSNRELAFDFCRADDKKMNRRLSTVGGLTFLLYLFIAGAI